jgi:uncharacterized membrane protein YsdA (DUF1294 family)
MIALFFLLIVFAMALMGWFPIVLAQVYLILSAVTLLMYGLDKLFAINKKQRISEKTLHVVALLGGWPGAYLGQQHVRFFHLFFVFYLSRIIYQAHTSITLRHSKLNTPVLIQLGTTPLVPSQKR